MTRKELLSPAQLQELAQLYTTHSYLRLAEYFGVSTRQVRNALEDLGLEKPNARPRAKEAPLKKRRRWTPEQLEEWKELYPRLSHEALMQYFKCTIYELRVVRDKYNLKKEDAVLSAIRQKNIHRCRRRSIEEKWTAEQLAWFKTHAPRFTMEQLARELRTTVGAIRGAVRRLGIKFSRDLSDEQVAWLKAHYAERTYEEIGEQLGLTVDGARYQCKKYSLVKSRKQRNSVQSRVALDAPLKPTMYIDEETGWRVSRRFKRQNGKYYLWVRLDGRWDMLHYAVWRRAGRTIPEGMLLRFVDGDTENCRLDNLVLGTRSEVLRDNQRYRGASIGRPRLSQEEKARREAEKQHKKLKREGDLLARRQARQRKLEAEAAAKKEARRLKREAKELARKEALRVVSAQKAEERRRARALKEEQKAARAQRQKEKQAVERKWDAQRTENKKRQDSRRFQDRPLDLSRSIEVKIMGKHTKIYLRPGQDAEEVRRRYEKKVA